MAGWLTQAARVHKDRGASNLAERDGTLRARPAPSAAAIRRRSSRTGLPITAPAGESKSAKSGRNPILTAITAEHRDFPAGGRNSPRRNPANRHQLLSRGCEVGAGARIV